MLLRNYEETAQPIVHDVGRAISAYRREGSRGTTAAGTQVGDSEKHSLQVYGSRLKVGPHKYIDNGHYLTAKSSDGNYGIRFETEDGKITMYYAGRFDALQLVERCQ
jgi:hypothetical protein